MRLEGAGAQDTGIAVNIAKLLQRCITAGLKTVTDQVPLSPGIVSTEIVPISMSGGAKRAGRRDR